MGWDDSVFILWCLVQQNDPNQYSPISLLLRVCSLGCSSGNFTTLIFARAFP